MSDAVLAITALAGIIAVAVSGYRFIERDDLVLDEALRDELPALWTEAAADEVARR